MNGSPRVALAAGRRTGEITPVMIAGFAFPVVVRHCRNALLLVALWGAAVHAQGPSGCDPARRVQQMDFTGAAQVDDATLTAAIVTREPTYAVRILHLGKLPCSDPHDVQLDALRLAVLHRQAGWLQARVTARTTATANGVQLRF